MPKLLVSLPDGSDASHDLQEPTVTVGRVSDNLLQIDDISVSSHHAQLTLGDGGDYVLQDLGSTNGTWVNAEEAAEGADHPLRDGDKIRFGKIDATYASEKPGEARPMPESENVKAVAGSSSTRPADFANASPFQTKKKKKDPVGNAILAFSVVAFLAFAAAVAAVFSIKNPL